MDPFVTYHAVGAPGAPMMICAALGGLQGSLCDHPHQRRQGVFAMPVSYHTTRPDQLEVISGASPEAIRNFLWRENWSLGDYEITTAEVPFGSPRHRWGIAVKHPDGSVELIPDQPA